MRAYYKRTNFIFTYYAAVMLHPGLKFNYFEEKWASNKAWINNCKKAVKDY